LPGILSWCPASDIDIGETLCENANQEALPAITVDEPTISVNFLVNNSLAGRKENMSITNSFVNA
jgi:GTP-binding protein